MADPAGRQSLASRQRGPASRLALLLLSAFFVAASCARAPRRATPATPPVPVGDAGARRLAPALDALHVTPAALRRRPPRIAQCLHNADAARFRRRPGDLVVWPDPGLRRMLTDTAAGDIPLALLGARRPTAPPGPAMLDDAIWAWRTTATAVRNELRDAYARVDPDVLSELAAEPFTGPPSADAPAETRAAVEAAGEASRRRYCDVARALDTGRIDAALARLWRATLALEGAVRTLPPTAWPPFSERRTTPDGWTIAVGTFGDDVVEPGWNLYLDPGGNDRIAANAPSEPGFVQAAVDLAGDDHYFAIAGGSGLAGAIGGCSVLIDGAGDDAYDGGRWSVGAAAFGGAILLDRSGNDAYAAPSAGVGAALHGTALVLDGGGQDVYTVDVQGEAFAGPAGFALLWDAGGDDTYSAGGRVVDTVSGRTGTTLAMAQACAVGLRPDAEGGTAMLVDLGGDDRYFGEIFAQGVGYWGGVGLLWDRAGDDTYKSVQYAQGSGLHFGIGLLRDDTGDDRYWSGGLAQGCGHDLGIGVCVDGAGDDEYAAVGLAAGASTGGGLGIFFEGGGNDRYHLTSISNLGCDGSTADRPGTAIYLDLGGFDRFYNPGPQAETSAPARDGAAWYTGRRGVAVNRPD